MGHLWDFLILKKGHHPYRCKVNWTLAEEYARQKLSTEARMADRFCRLCHQEQPIIFDGQQIVFIRTVSNLPEIFTPAEWEQLKAKHYIHELGFLSNICPDYALILSTGLLQLRSSTDRYGRAAIDSLIELSDKYLEKAKQLRRWDLVDILTQVPRYPARSFREALQFFRIIHFGLWLEGNYHNNIGPFHILKDTVCRICPFEGQIVVFNQSFRQNGSRCQHLVLVYRFRPLRLRVPQFSQLTRSAKVR